MARKLTASIAAAALVALLWVWASAAPAKENVGILFKGSVYPGKDAKYTFYEGGGIVPLMVVNPDGTKELGEFRFPEMETAQLVAVNEEVFPASSDLPALGRRYKIAKLVVMDMSGREVARVPLFSNQTYEVELDAVSYRCATGEKIFQRSYKDKVGGWPGFNTAQVSQTCRAVFDRFRLDLALFLKGS